MTTVIETKPYQPHGAALELFYSKDPEVLLDGPADTGKSRACLEKLYICAHKYPGMRTLICRKTRRSLTQAAMVSFEKKSYLLNR
ncbi:MAG: phage terminase large subunit [bacterium]|nr:MAG: phage terminase large subunit [bacterium]